MCVVRLLCLLALCLASAAVAQADASAAAPAAEPARPPAPAPIPIAEIAAHADTAAERLRAVGSSLAEIPALDAIDANLPALAREIDNRLLENRRLLAQRPPLEVLRSLEAGWRRVRDTLSAWTRDLGRAEERIARNLEQLGELERTWVVTRAAAAAEAPAEVLSRIDEQIASIRRVRGAAERSRARVVALQGRVAVQDARVREAMAVLRQAREDVVSRLLAKDSPAIWDPVLRTRAAETLDDQARSSWSAQVAALADYARHRPSRFLAHALFLVLVAGCFYWARREAGRWVAHEPDLRRTALVFQTPIATALVATLFATRAIYPQAPRLLWAASGALALIPSVYILRRLVAAEVRPALYVLMTLYFVDQVRAVVAALPMLPRALFLVEMTAAAVFAAWLVASLRRTPGDPGAGPLRRVLKAAAIAGLCVSIATLLANAAGFVRLANLLGNGMLLSAYFALILYVTVAILDGLVMIALRVRPLRLLGMVQRHRAILRRRVRRALLWIAAAAWTLFTLERLTLREPLLRVVREAVTAEAVIGSLRVSLGDVLAFAATVYASFLFSRLVRFLLEEDVYPRVDLARGLPYAISTVTHYAILVVGFFAAMAALGLDMTKATILAGAFTVGVGFGLQNIFNNFVSGLILLFERPVKVGDVIEMDPASTGVVERIGIRASVIRTPTGAQLIVPNGKLISDRFTNWTFSTRGRSIEVPVSVVLAADPAQAIEVLERVAAGHPLVSDYPPPKAIVTRLGPDWIGLELRAWTDHATDWTQIRSDLAVQIAQALPAAGITLR